MATEMMRNNPGMMSMMENMVGGMSQEQLDAMVGNDCYTSHSAWLTLLATVPCCSSA